MAAPSCTIDTSCVIALDSLELVPSLSFLFARVLVPTAVRIELARRRKAKESLRRLLDSYAFLEICHDYDKGAVDVLLIERAIQRVKDRGETEAVVQAASLGTVVIVDDPWGRELANRYSLEFHGTLWVLQRLTELELLAPSVLRSGLTELLRKGIRFPKDAIDSLLLASGEAPLTGEDT